MKMINNADVINDTITLPIQHISGTPGIIFIFVCVFVLVSSVRIIVNKNLYGIRYSLIVVLAAIAAVAFIVVDINDGKNTVEPFITQLEKHDIQPNTKNPINTIRKSVKTPQKITAVVDGEVKTIELMTVKRDGSYIVSWEVQ